MEGRKNSTEQIQRAASASSPKKLIFAVGVPVLVAAGVWLMLAQRASAPPSHATVTASVTTSDHISLATELNLPPGTGKVAAVILIHEFSKDHHQWDAYIQDFIHAGFAVVTYDIRGFGASKLPTVPTDFNAWYNAMPNDVPAVIGYLKQQPRVDANRITVIGAVLGANIAYVASGSNYGIHRTVLLSPHVTPGVLDGSTVKDFSPTGILAMSNFDETNFTQPLLAYTKDPKDSYASEMNKDRGVDLLKDPKYLGRVLSWIAQ